MKLAQQREQKPRLSENKLLKKSVSAGVIGFFSWIFIFVIWIPLASLKKFGEIGSITPINVLRIPKLYTKSLLAGIIFFLFFYLTLKFGEKSRIVKIVMWLGILLYAMFYLGYVFLLFFFRF